MLQQRIGKWVASLAVLLVLVLPLDGEFFTAVSDLEKLLDTEGKVSEIIAEYVAHEEERLKHIRWFIRQYEEQYRAAITDSEAFLSNPINAFLLVKRLTADLQAMFYLSDAELTKGSFGRVGQRMSDLPMPDMEDLRGAALALVRLQKVYHLNTSALASGNIKGVPLTNNMTAADCFVVGREAFGGGEFAHALHWMQECLLRLDAEAPKTANSTATLHFISQAHLQLGNVEKAVEVTKQIIAADPSNPRAHQYMSDLLTTPIIPHEPPFEPSDGLKQVYEDYERLCREEDVQNEEERSLRCFYSSSGSPFLQLQPLRVEELRLHPQVLMFHSVVTAREADTLRDIARPKLERAVVYDDKTGILKTAQYRISKSAWLDDPDHQVVVRVNRRIEEITGLSRKTAEELHVINYGIGGQYEPHIDFAQYGEIGLVGKGNRIATFILYLSDVDAGGATVFPAIDVIARPQKGSATFWYNLFRNGSGIFDTKHAGCPVLAGSKWIATKWFHEWEQEFRRRCSLNPEE